MLNVPNAITVLRTLLIPLIGWLLLREDYAPAFWLFVACAAGDAADGLIARRWNLQTRFGAIADPLADKLTMLTATVLLGWQGWLPWWFAVLVVGRDLLIVGGALAYHLLIGHVEMAPTWLSKLNTALEFVLLASVLAWGAGYLWQGLWFDLLLYATMTTVVASGAHYVAVWGARAARARRLVRPG
jgi:cardiolipin synthase